MYITAFALILLLSIYYGYILTDTARQSMSEITVGPDGDFILAFGGKVNSVTVKAAIGLVILLADVVFGGIGLFKKLRRYPEGVLTVAVLITMAVSHNNTLLAEFMFFKYNFNITESAVVFFSKYAAWAVAFVLYLASVPMSGGIKS